MERKVMIECLKNSIKELREEKFNDYRKTDIEKASLNFVDIIEQQNNEVIEMLEGLVSDVGNLLCDVADLDFEWQQAGYYETAKLFLKRLKSNNCKHKNINRQDGLGKCMDCGVRNY